MIAGYDGVALTNVAGLVQVAANALVEVRREDNDALAPLFTDITAAVGKSNPFNADSEGRFEFFLETLSVGYKITVTKGADVNIKHNVPIGLHIVAASTIEIERWKRRSRLFAAMHLY